MLQNRVHARSLDEVGPEGHQGATLFKDMTIDSKILLVRLITFSWKVITGTYCIVYINTLNQFCGAGAGGAAIF